MLGNVVRIVANVNFSCVPVGVVYPGEVTEGIHALIESFEKTWVGEMGAYGYAACPDADELLLHEGDAFIGFTDNVRREGIPFVHPELDGIGTCGQGIVYGDGSRNLTPRVCALIGIAGEGGAYGDDALHIVFTDVGSG